MKRQNQDKLKYKKITDVPSDLLKKLKASDETSTTNFDTQRND